MLYMTVGDKTNTHTAQRVLKEGEGALFVPMQLPVFTQRELDGMKEQTFGQNVAQILNLFFGTELTGWDVELCVGRYPMKLASLSGKVQSAELWHNLEGTYSQFIQRLLTLLGGAPCDNGWGPVAIRIATLFGIWGELQKQGIGTFHIACAGSDLQTVFAAWYARQMGLPVGKLLCGCRENAPFWSLLYRGSYPASGQEHPALERLVFCALGQGEWSAYCQARKACRSYLPEEALWKSFTDGFFVAAVGTERLPMVINSLYRTDGYFADEDLAYGYSALQDYRSRRGDHTPALLLSRESPVASSEVIGAATGLRPEDIKKKVVMV